MNPEASTSRAASRFQSLAPPIAESAANQTQQRSTMHDEDDPERPLGIHLKRFDAWDMAVDQLHDYLGGVAKIHHRTAKELEEVCENMTVPFATQESHFLGEHGLQDIYSEIRAQTLSIAQAHKALADKITQSMIKVGKGQAAVKNPIERHNEEIEDTPGKQDTIRRTDIKSRIEQYMKEIQDGPGKQATIVAEQRELATRFTKELSDSVSSLENDPMAVTSKTDPYVTWSGTILRLTYHSYIVMQRALHQRNNLVSEEYALNRAVLEMRDSSKKLENEIVEVIKSAWETYAEAQMNLDASIFFSYEGLRARMASLQADEEWRALKDRPDHFTPTVYQNYHVRSRCTGLLERKGNSTAFRTGYFVLTHAGFLHEFQSSDDPGKWAPVFSLFIPLCTLIAPSRAPIEATGDAPKEFSIEGREERGETMESPRKDKHTIRMQSGSDMTRWLEVIESLCFDTIEEPDRDAEIRVAEEENRDDEGPRCEQRRKPFGPRVRFVTTPQYGDRRMRRS
ncbi:hypothetical protein C8R47DRAFT_597566 [Mycena vitilis]|nr:hypothetical protein C8R47DRAFT_597566 [Mycena vitilis]